MHQENVLGLEYDNQSDFRHNSYYIPFDSAMLLVITTAAIKAVPEFFWNMTNLL